MIEYANAAFYKTLGYRYSSLQEFLSPLEMKKTKHAIRFCIENSMEENAMIRLDERSDIVYQVRFKPVDECTILLLANAELQSSLDTDQKEIVSLFGNIRETADNGIWFIDFGLQRASWSDGMYQILELDKHACEAMVSDDTDFYLQFVDHADLPLLLEKRKELMETGADVDLVYHVITSKGNRKKIHTTINILEKNGGTVVKCVGVSRDITDHTKLSELLLQQTSELALREKMLQFGSWQYDLKTGHMEWSDGTYWLFGYDPYAERRFMHVDLDLVLSHLDETDANTILDFFKDPDHEKRENTDSSFLITRKNGDKRKLELQVKVLRNESGIAEKIYGTVRDITEKDQLVQELISYKKMVQEKEEFLGQGSFEYEIETGRNYISEGLLKIYEISKEEAEDLTLRRLFENCFDPKEQQRIYAVFKELILSGGAREIEVSATVNGKLKDLEVYVKALQTISGKTERLVGTTKDITAIKGLYNQLLRFKEDLTEREHLLKHGTWDLDLATGRYSCSDGLFEVFGVNNSISGFNMEDHLLPGEVEKLKASKQEVLRNGSAYLDDLMIRTVDGSLKYIEMFSKLILNSKGEPVRIVGIGRDVSRLQSFKKELKDQVMRGEVMNQELTEAKGKLETKLLELEKANQELQLYKQTMLDKDEFLNQGTWEMDIKTGNIEYSRGIYRLFGYHHKEEMAAWDKVGKDLSLHIDEDERKRSSEDWVKILEEADTYLREMEITAKDGYRRRLETFGKVFRDENGKAYKVIGTTRDITKLKEYEQELEVKINELNRSNRDLEEFAYIASHDLHEPLRKLSTFGQRLGSNADKELSATNKDYLNRMLKATENMRNLIDNLLEFSRVTRGGATFFKTDLDQLVSEVLSEQELRIEETKAEIVVDPLPQLEVVPSQIKQVFNNLLNNALKFVRPGVKPVISFRCQHLSLEEQKYLRLKQNREYFKITVEDNGIGFDRIYAEKIFQIFQRLHGKSEYTGSGIGLAICRKIADNHKGMIFAESEPGKGSRFMIILPNKP
jgi:PAS domain S-box-containing protein